MATRKKKTDSILLIPPYQAMALWQQAVKSQRACDILKFILKPNASRQLIMGSVFNNTQVAVFLHELGEALTSKDPTSIYSLVQHQAKALALTITEDPAVKQMIGLLSGKQMEVQELFLNLSKSIENYTQEE